MPKATIYHNPRCSKSRKTLELLQNNNIQPEVILYLDTPPDKAELCKILKLLAIEPRQLLRASEEAYKAQKLSNQSLTDEDLIEAMVNTPKLIERPIVIVNNKAVIGRPPENVLEIL